MAEVFGVRIPTLPIPSVKPITDEYPMTFTLEDFGFDADVALVAGEWTPIATYTVEAGMEYCMGRRFDGYIYVSLENTSDVQFHGKIRFVVSNPAETKKQVVAEFGTRTMGSASDKAQKPAFPLAPPWVTQDSKIIVEVDPESSDSLDYGNTLSAIDLTARVVK